MKPFQLLPPAWAHCFAVTFHPLTFTILPVSAAQTRLCSAAFAAVFMMCSVWHKKLNLGLMTPQTRLPADVKPPSCLPSQHVGAHLGSQLGPRQWCPQLTWTDSDVLIWQIYIVIQVCLYNRQQLYLYVFVQQTIGIFIQVYLYNCITTGVSLGVNIYANKYLMMYFHQLVEIWFPVDQCQEKTLNLLSFKVVKQRNMETSGGDWILFLSTVHETSHCYER